MTEQEHVFRVSIEIDGTRLVLLITAHSAEDALARIRADYTAAGICTYIAERDGQHREIHLSWRNIATFTPPVIAPA